MAPKSVSGRVVKTRMFALVASTVDVLKSTNAPSLRPIQFRCISLTGSGQSTPPRSSSRRCAYRVMRIIHCLSGRLYTGKFPRSLRPSAVTSSFASTVPSCGHQLTGASSRYARR